jgi:effector-binding domain-containing protein
MSDDASQPNGSEPRIEERDAQAYVGIRRLVTNGVPAAVDQAFPALFAWLGERGVEPSGPPFIRTYEIDEHGEPLELDVAVPVREAVPVDGAVRADVLPEGRYVTLRHVGPYRSATERDLADARESLVGYAQERGLAFARESERGSILPCCVERFHVGPHETPDHSKWETEFAYLILE